MVNDAHSVEHVHDLIVYIQGVLLFRYTCNCRCKVAKYFVFCMRGSRGGIGGPDPPPPEIFILFLQLFSGSLRSPVLNIALKFEKSESPPRLKGLSLLPSYKLSLALFMKVLFPCLCRLKLYDFTPFQPKIFWGRTPIPPPPCDITCTFYKAKTIISNVFYMEGKTRDVIFIKSIVCKAVSRAKIDFDHTKAIDTEAPYPLFVSVCVVVVVVVVFFLLVKKFGRLDPPPPPHLDENSWIRACSGFFFSN